MSEAYALPDKLCALIALPRSGTTLITSTYSVHSQVAAVFEPWNARKDFQTLRPIIRDIALEARLGDLSRKFLFVKETTTRLEYIENIKSLLKDAPPVVERYLLVAIRRPDQTFLSEVARRGEWWNDKVTVGPEAFANWLQKSRLALRVIINFALEANGVAISLGEFASRPKAVLDQLSVYTGIPVESAQIEYEKHLNLKIVRGDRIVQETPMPINIDSVNFRDERRTQVLEYLKDTDEKIWFSAFDRFYDLICEYGGVLNIRKTPQLLIKTLTGS